MLLEDGTSTVVSFMGTTEAVHLRCDGGTKSDHLSPKIGIEADYTVKVRLRIGSSLILSCLEQFVGLGDDVDISRDRLGCESDHDVYERFVGILGRDSGL